MIAAPDGDHLWPCFDLLKAIREVATGSFVCKPHRIKSESKVLKQALDQLVEQIQSEFPGLTNARWVALRLLEGDERIIEAVRSGELEGLTRIESELEHVAA